MTQTQQAITEALRRLVDEIDGQILPLSDGSREALSDSRAALAALESAYPAEPAVAQACPTCADSDTPGWMMQPGHDGEQCPTCTPKDGSMIGGTGVVPMEPTAAPAEDANPPACECAVRAALEGVLGFLPSNDSLYHKLSTDLRAEKEAARAALSAPCPTAELRDEIEQHNLWRAEAYRQIAELKALKREAAEALKPFANGWTEPDADKPQWNVLDLRHAAKVYERLKAEDPR